MTGRLVQMSGVVADLVYEVTDVPKPGEEAEVTGFTLTPGGGFNAMVAARRAGMAVTYGGKIGTGPLGEIVRAGLAQEDIASGLAPDAQRDQGCCTVMVDRAGERTFVSSPGAEGHLDARDLAQIDRTEADWLLLSGYALHAPGSRQALTAWLSQDAPRAPLIFDPSPVVGRLAPETRDAALRRATWISANRAEAVALTGQGEARDAAHALAQNRAGGAVVRIGADGCFVSTGAACLHIPGYPAASIDTNGAGDTHVGSFIAALHITGDPFEAARYANAAAALSTEIKGPATAPRPQAVAQRRVTDHAGEHHRSLGR